MVVVEEIKESCGAKVIFESWIFQDELGLISG